jgi:S1/P1 Nuclease
MPTILIYKVRYLLAMLIFIFPGGEARAWGDLGHKVICEIAYRSAGPGARTAIDRLIAIDTQYKTFSDSCIYPDHPRIRADEHFLNLPRDSKGLTSDACPLATTCVLTAILRDFDILKSKDEPDMNRVIALKSLGHWVGDIHQPLHVSFLDDKGGNKISTSGQNCTEQNLHAVWDTCLVLFSVGPEVSEGASALLAVVTPEEKAQWIASVPRDWANG